MINRLETMARFAEPDDVKPLAVCAFCDSELHGGETVRIYDSETYCSAECVADAVSYIKTLGDE